MVNGLVGTKQELEPGRSWNERGAVYYGARLVRFSDLCSREMRTDNREMRTKKCSLFSLLCSLFSFLRSMFSVLEMRTDNISLWWPVSSLLCSLYLCMCNRISLFSFSLLCSLFSVLYSKEQKTENRTNRPNENRETRTEKHSCQATAKNKEQRTLVA